MRVNFYAGSISLLACLGYTTAEETYANSEMATIYEPMGAFEFSQIEEKPLDKADRKGLNAMKKMEAEKKADKKKASEKKEMDKKKAEVSAVKSKNKKMEAVLHASKQEKVLRDKLKTEGAKVSL